MAPLNWMHHTLIQALLSRGPLEEKEFHDIFSGVSGKNPDIHKKIFDDVLLKINKELAYVKFELRGCRNQYDGKVYYGVVNTVADEQSKLGTKYSIPQIAFYRAILDAIIHDTTAHGCISNIDALNIRLDSQTGQASQDGAACVPTAFKSFSLAQKEKTLNELIQDQWLSSSSDGNIGLGVRSFLDLRGWFRNNDFPSCDVCNEAGIKADMCSGEGCNVRIHSYCLKKKFYRKVSSVCPVCGTPWHFSDLDWENDECNDDAPSEAPSDGLRERRKHQVCKAEAVEAAQNRRQETADHTVLRRLRSHKVEAAPDALESEPNPEPRHPPEARMGRKSRRV
ncbi:unnamed protein product [Spirodela intermedia]|uniref:Non-structural maintenance of chromosomes element 1 homolog n=1 Tax=Spirodela intermedia TaxID=51605 RepID=A0A7I8JYI4_SPIIN|nr:unnamed protein product [Spirodela intermedia]